MVVLTVWQYHIVELIGSQGWEEGSCCVLIFMNLEEGNLQELSRSGGFALTSIREGCLGQMLSALDFLDH